MEIIQNNTPEEQSDQTPKNDNPIPSCSKMLTSSISSLSEEGNQSPPRKQPRIDACIIKQSSFEDGGKKATEITNKLIFMITKDNMPLRTVDKEGFNNFMKLLAPLYKIPSRSTVTSLIENKYQVLSNAVKLQISEVDDLSLTTDIWTDPMNTKSFLGIAAHYIKDHKHKSITIGVNELNERHNSHYIESCLNNVVKEWNINTENILAVVCDNGANIKKAVKDAFGENKQLSCFVHSINLIPSKVLESEHINAIQKKVKGIVTFFKKSVVAMDHLRAMTDFKLIQSVDTRWNSAHDMFLRFIELSDTVGSILLKLPMAPDMITATELQTVKEFVELLKPFKDATNIVSGEFYLTASKVIPICNTIRKTLSLLNPITQIGNNMKELLSKQFKERFQNIEEVTILAMATVLDPRFKTIHFSNREICSNIVSEIAVMLNSSILNEISSNENNPKSLHIDSNNFWSYHEILLHQSRENKDFDPDEFSDDYKLYLNKPPIEMNACPINFWKNDNSVLSKLSQRYLAAIASSVPSERLFSKTGRILTESRNRLTAEHLQQLLFLGSLSYEDWM